MCDECSISTLLHLKLVDFLLCRFPSQFSGKNHTDISCESQRKGIGNKCSLKEQKRQ